METMITGKQMRNVLRLFVYVCFLVVIAQLNVSAQAPVKIYTIKNGKMYIGLSKSLSEPALDSFINKFNLTELALKSFIKDNIADSIKLNGWNIEINNKDEIAISKPMLSPAEMNNPGEQLDLSIADRFPAKSGIVFGFNKFKKGAAFEVHDSMVSFYIRGNLEAKRVMLAGSFNDFSPDALPMKKNDSGWIANVKLGAGKYWYKFIVDGDWRIDEDNQQRENDGKGNTNSIYYKTNTLFLLNGYENEKRIYVAGSFNNWQNKELLLRKSSKGWGLALYLADGTYTYRFFADGNWFIDPANPDKLPNEFNDFNSVIKIGMPYLFRLSGFLEARHVMLTGSFNGWRKEELFMNKTNSGWELPYTLGFGNYEYRFVVDGTEITDPANPVYTGIDRAKGNSVLILGPNYTFRLQGFENAKSVILAGDFNSFNEHAYAMNKHGNDWIFSVHLSNGKHLYKFVVDGKWIIDPQNKLWEQNEYGTGNSVIWIEPNQ
ncbi:MAG: glycogen-binding domain-containing protein [Ferruginibacter sp.]